MRDAAEAEIGAAGTGTGADAAAQYRALFVTLGSFSHINTQLLAALQSQCPDVEFETFSLSGQMRGDYPALLRCGLGALREYGLRGMGARARLRYRLFRNQAYIRWAAGLVQQRFAGRGFDFTVQTQSMFSAALPGCPNFVYTDHAARARLADEDQDGTGQPSAAWLDCERAIYEEAAHVFTFGPKIRDFLTGSYGIAPGKVSAIGAGASVRPAQPPQTAPERYGRRNILFVGVEWDRKGGPELAKAFARLRQRLPDATLTIIGCTPDIHLEGCRVLGRLPLEALEAHFHEASCFCMPSRVEPFGVVFLEAMQFGLPVVSTTAGDIGAIVRDGGTGRLAAPRDSAGLEQALYEVLADPGTCRSMGLAALERGRQFTWEAVARRIAAHAPGAASRPAAQELAW